MSDLGAYVRRMIEGGMDPVEAATIAAQIFQAGVGAAPYRDPQPVRQETAHDRKKQYDRNYRKNERETKSYDNRTTSYDSSDSLSLEVSKVSPHTPLPNLPKPYLPPAPKGACPQGGETGFEDFWKIYPRKIGKGAARKAWRKTAKSRPSLAVLTAAVERYIANKSPDIDFCHAATWLNAARWDDEWPDKPETRSHSPPWAPKPLNEDRVARLLAEKQRELDENRGAA